MISDKEIIDFTLLHKTERKDVLIYKPEVVLKSVLTPEEYAKLEICLGEDSRSAGEVYIRCEDVFILRTLPKMIPEETVNTVLKEISLKNFYADDGEGMFNIIPQYIPLHVEEAIRSNLKPNSPPLLQSEKNKISMHYDEATVNSYFLLNNTCDEFFYKKNHEHIPGMMLIEAARQAVYDYVYTHSGHEFGTVSISMSKIEVVFSDYSVSSYPVEILFSHHEKIRRQKPKKIEKKAWYYQRGKLTGTFFLEGGIIPISTFDALRNEKYSKKHQFFPLKDNRFIEISTAERQSLKMKVASLTLNEIIVENSYNYQFDEIKGILIEGIVFPIEKFLSSAESDNEICITFGTLSRSQKLLINKIINTHYYHKDSFNRNGLSLHH